MGKGNRDKLSIPSLRVSRPASLSNRELGLFANQMGRSIEDVGNIHAVGSMSVTLLPGNAFLGVINSLTARDQRSFRPKFDDFESAMREKLADRPETINFVAESLAFYRSSNNKIRNGISAIALQSDENKNRGVNTELNLIKGVFSDFGLPTPSLLPHKQHLTIGEVSLGRLEASEGRNPNSLLPAGATVPEHVILDGIKITSIRASNR